MADGICAADVRYPDFAVPSSSGVLSTAGKPASVAGGENCLIRTNPSYSVDIERDLPCGDIASIGKLGDMGFGENRRQIGGMLFREG